MMRQKGFTSFGKLTTTDPCYGLHTVVAGGFDERRFLGGGKFLKRSARLSFDANYRLKPKT